MVLQVWGSCSTDPSLRLDPDSTSEAETTDTIVESARDELRRHRWRHGWGQLGFETDLIQRHEEAPCPSRVLELLETIHTPTSRRHALTDDVVLILVHNDRAQAALALLARAIDAVEPYRILSWRSTVGRRSRLLETSAQAAAFSGDHALAIETLELWRPTSWCGVCNDYQRTRISRLRFEQLRQLERWGDVEALCVRLVADGNFEPCIGEAWLDAMHELEPELAPELALARLSAFSISESDAADLAGSLEHSRLLRATAEERIRNIAVLGRPHADSVCVEVRRSSPGRIEQLATPLFGDDVDVAQSVATILAQSGHFAVGSILDRAKTAYSNRGSDWESWIDLEIAAWTAMRNRLAALEP